MKLSVIIALFNTEDYIEKCIRSVYDNSILDSKEFEIIVINDGSTDNSRVIVEQLQKEYNNIILINKENEGQSSARNIGFKLAKGEYIFCLDSDDYVDSVNFFRALDFALERDLDLLPIRFIKTSKEGDYILESDNYEIVKDVISGVEFMNKFVISGSMARYFYKTQIIKTYKLSLIEGIYHEDEEFVIKFLSYVNRISYNQLPTYYYYRRETSTLNNNNIQHRKKLINDIIVVIESLTELINKNLNNLDLINGIEKKKQQLVLSIFLRMYREKFDKNLVNEIINKLKSKSLYPLKSHRLDWKKKIICKILNINIILKIIYTY
ncbi:glycosyltransferase [Elizabethkingia anophelis]|uniref:glycosyltransferase family 2 protein n=1 Tax=Elizabethkingia anophelis TaxID=1117645 RepID=UPI0003F77551|nr:glycosyltransferase [Elizabethkingia anophelis]MCT3746627.1 glycosyltransferase [Elizabethkingia anophelis]MCT3924709.1 glycosyltransferase [Elizabethkingia anophelis]MCT4063861.1 glycosyltransferase [Elizabethkingia anophelis]MCT4110095.1 glycosyltransferase [Elizabethkingia anophelis]MDC8026368.1 glycosyltransferase [Elizabethkingia anophelis]